MFVLFITGFISISLSVEYSRNPVTNTGMDCFSLKKKEEEEEEEKCNMGSKVTDLSVP